MSAPKFAASQAELARVLGVTRQRVWWNLRKPGNPGKRQDGRYDVTAWRQFFKSEAERRDDPTTRELRAEQLRLQIQKLELQLEMMRRDHVPVADVQSCAEKLAAKVGLIVSRIHFCAPEIVNLSVADAEDRLKALEDDTLLALSRLCIENFNGSV